MPRGPFFSRLFFLRKARPSLNRLCPDGKHFLSNVPFFLFTRFFFVRQSATCWSVWCARAGCFWFRLRCFPRRLGLEMKWLAVYVALSRVPSLKQLQDFRISVSVHDTRVFISGAPLINKW